MYNNRNIKNVSLPSSVVSELCQAVPFAPWTVKNFPIFLVSQNIRGFRTVLLDNVGMIIMTMVAIKYSCWH